MSTPEKPLLTAERLRQLLSYDPETGDFHWMVATALREALENLISVVDAVANSGDYGIADDAIEQLQGGIEDAQSALALSLTNQEGAAP